MENISTLQASYDNIVILSKHVQELLEAPAGMFSQLLGTVDGLVTSATATKDEAVQHLMDTVKGKAADWHASYSEDQGLHGMRSIVLSLSDKVFGKLAQPFTMLDQQLDQLPSMQADQRQARVQQIIQQAKGEINSLESFAESVNQQLQEASNLCSTFWNASNNVRGELEELLVKVTTVKAQYETILPHLRDEIAIIDKQINEKQQQIDDLQNRVNDLHSKIDTAEDAHNVMKFIPIPIVLITDGLLGFYRDDLHNAEGMLENARGREMEALKNNLGDKEKMLKQSEEGVQVLANASNMEAPLGGLKGSIQQLQTQVGDLQNATVATKSLQTNVFNVAMGQGEDALLQLIRDLAKAAAGK